jgi:hypothetical protein
MKTEFWEILVPASNNKDLNFTYEHHKEWDAFVKHLTGGVTIMKTAKGEWVSPDGKLYIDRMIPCRIACTRYEILRIIDFTITHYNQEAVLAYKISDDVILKHRKEPKSFERPPDFPKPPVSRIIAEGMSGSCPKCHSSEKRTWLGLGKKIGCIQPECENYYKNKK